MKKVILQIVFAFVFPSLALAQTAAPVETAARQAILIDADTGTVLFDKDADTPMAPSSMSKMVTMYMVFDALRTGKLVMSQELPVSEHAWKQEGSRMFLNAGQKARVEDLIRGVIVQSGNDAAVVFAETLGGSEGNFAGMMNAKAHELGLSHSHFVNATGLPDPQHYSTAHDLAMVAIALIRDFPDYYHYFSEQEFTFNNIKQGNRNPLLYRTMNVDGLKTGHTEEGGYGLTASAVRDGRRLVLVLNGLSDMQARADESAHLLDWGYREFGVYPIVKAGDKLADAKTWLGTLPTVPLLAEKDVTLTLPRGARAGLKTEVMFEEPLAAPIAKGQPVGKLTIAAPGMDPKEIRLLAGADVSQVGFFARVAAKLNMFLGRT